MSALAEVQRAFLSYLMAPDDGVVAGIADGRLAASTGLRIYSHAYRARSVEALSNDHRMLGLYLGDALWQSMCDGYIDAHPSKVRSLRHFGAALPGYLACTSPFDADPRIAELAAFERALLDSFDAADAIPVGFADLCAIDALQWPTLGLALHPTLRVIDVQTNAVDAWSALNSGSAPPTSDRALVPAWATWRDAERVGRFRSLDDVEHAALTCARAGATIAAMCQELASRLPADDVPPRTLQLLQQWFVDGWIVGIA